MCLYPRLITNRKFAMNKKNGGVIPLCIDERTKMVPVGCTKCIECRKQKAREWQVRLQEEVRTETNGKFITLTFSNESIKEIAEDIKGLEGYELDNEIATKAMRRFLERWRKKHKKSVKHWFITELGHKGTENIHMHGIIWTNETVDEIEKQWKYGWIWKGKENAMGGLENYVTERTVNYMMKYVTKIDKRNEEYKPKILTSPGIGSKYTERKDFEKSKYKAGETKEYYTTKTGHKIAMPIYWRNKLYTEEEREKLWIEKLDRQERYILGQRVDISKNDDNYYKLLNYARNKNKRLGYGNDEINWERKKYENERRKIKFAERIKGI